MPDVGNDNPDLPRPEPSSVDPLPDVPAEASDPDPTPTKPLKPSGETKSDQGIAKRGKKEKPEPESPLGKLWYNWVKPIGLVVLIVVVFRSMLLDWNDVPTGSMEPEIQVGDRIAVNRLAYGLQFPLTGPTIGIPFTPFQWDNPLDGIPQIAWSQPDRGDIVTFWNPVTDVRMVKRIVAKPGDTISMSGGQLTITSATEDEAGTYTDITPETPRQTKYGEGGAGGKTLFVKDDLEDLKESILGETRTVQHIKKRWSRDAKVIQLPNGMRYIIDQDYLMEYFDRGPLFKAYVAGIGGPPVTEIAQIIDGHTHLNNKPVTYNEFAEVMLAEYSEGNTAKLLKQADLGIDEHNLLIDGEPVPFEVFRLAFDKSLRKLNKTEIESLRSFRSTLGILHQTLMTNFGPVTLGKGEFYMVGDNRNNSHDSRYFGPVQQNEITGKAFAVAFSFKDNEMLTLPPNPAFDRWLKDLD